MLPRPAALSLFLALAIHVSIPAAQEPSIVGTWKLLAWETHNADGTVVRQYGEHPLGYFIYDATSHLSIQVMGNPPTDPPAYFGYFGTYTVDSARGIVIHHIEGATTSRNIGQDEPRQFRIEGDHLTIRIPQAQGNGYAIREFVRVR
jgi:hypothetical protein